MDPNGILFINPRAGSLTPAEESELRGRAAESRLEVRDIVPGLDVRQVVRDSIDAGLRRFLVAGGDGSIHHVLQGIVHTDATLGILPVGTVNHLARDLKLPADWREALEVAMHGSIFQIDTGVINGRYFLNSVMAGLYPTMAGYREQFRSTNSSWQAYAKAFQMALRRFHHVNLILDVDDLPATIRTQMFVVSVNAYDLTQTGIVMPKLSLQDGRLTVYTLSSENRLQFVAAAARYLRGHAENVPGFRSMRASRLRIDTARPQIRLAVDGEIFQFAPPIHIAAAPSSLLVRVQRQEN